MKSFLLVKIALLPLPIYLLAQWRGYGLAGALAGVVWALGAAWFLRAWRRPPPLEAALLAGLAVIVAAHLAGWAELAARGHAVLLLALSLGAAVSVALRRPWTGEFAALAHRGVSGTRLFQAINMVISAVWAVLFGWLAVAAWVSLPTLAHWLPVAGGAVVSIALPGIMIRRGLARMAAGDRRNDWPAPDFVVRTKAPREDACDVAVIGSGIGGLTAAALLADAGLKVTVLEQHVVAGGFSHTWLRRARDPQTGERLLFRFDAGVHDVSGWWPGGTLHNLFGRLGIAQAIEWRPLDRCQVVDGRRIDVPRDWRAYVAVLASHYPHEAAGIRALFEDIRAVFDAMYSTVRYHGGIPGTPPTVADLLAFARAHPLAVAWTERPWSEFVGRHVRDEGVLRWINALGGYITDDLAQATVADMVPLFGYYFHGGCYPAGGSGRIADALVAAIEGRGGSVRLRTPVARLLAENGAVCGVLARDAGGREWRVAAQAVVCNADLGLLLGRLLDDAPARRLFEAQVGRPRPACSAFGVQLGVRGPIDLPPVVHLAAAGREVGIVVPAAVDPTCAPQGYATLELLRLAGNDEARTWFPEGIAGDAVRSRAWRRSEAYLARKRAAGDELVAQARELIADLDERIVYRAESSPLTYQRYAWTSDGAIYGTRGGHGRVPVKTPLRNLVLAGGATHGGGVEAVVISGAFAAEALLPGMLAGRSLSGVTGKVEIGRVSAAQTAV